MPYDEFPIEIIATLTGDPGRSVVLPLFVNVDDDNDNAPTIISPRDTTIDVSVTDADNSTIARLIAVDLDKGTNGQFNYSIDDSDIFAIDPLSGVISLTGIPSLNIYDVNVSVSDWGQPPLTSWRILTFLFRKNEMESKIRLSTGTISFNLSLTNAQQTSVIGRVTLASSAGSSNPAVRFQLISGKYDHLFEIDPVKGEIRRRRPVQISDIGIVDRLKLSVVAYLQGDSSNYDIAPLVIYIDHGNNFPPSFAKRNYFVKLPEGEAITDFLTVAANDPDLGIYGMITYRLLGDIDDMRISIDPNTGRLSCSSLLYSYKRMYSLEVVATDSLEGPLSKNQSAFVRIEVQNSLLQSLEFNATHFTMTVKENLPRGTVIGSATVHLKPTQSKVVYILNPGHSLIEINSTNGQLTTNGPIDRESLTFIEVIIHATSINPDSQQFQTTKATIIIKIADDNDNAPVPSQNPYIVHITDPGNVPSPLVQLIATDPDSSTVLTFTLDLDDPTTRTLSSQYHLHPSSAVLKYRYSSLRSFSKQHILRVIISDNGSAPQVTKVLVVIALHRSDGIVNLSPEKAVFRLLENPSVGAFIGQISIADSCTSGNTSHTIIDGINANLVHMHEPSGKLFVSSLAAVDRERTRQIVLWTQARCLGTDLIGFKKVIVNIDDVDDNPPVFAQAHYEAFVLEGQPPKTSVIRTLVNDPDEGVNSQVEYFIEMSPDEFFIDFDGTIRTTIPLNYHTKSLYHLIIKANSKSTPLLFAECRVTIHLVNINDQRPLFSSPVQQLRIPEDKPVGCLLTTITATDSDGTNRISYRIRPRTVANSTRFLSIAYDSGEVYLSRRLKALDVGRHEVDIVADDGKYSSSMMLSIEISDVNNEYPILREDGRHFLVAETQEIGSVVGYLHASDGDTGINGQVSFEIYPRVPWLDLHDYNNNTASIYLVSAPKFLGKVFFVGIQITDKAKEPTLRLSSVHTVALISETSNSHAPRFLNGSQVLLNIKESTLLGTELASLHCTDPEDQVTYSINASSLASPIHIEFMSGKIFLIKSLLDYPALNVEETIICQDNGKPSRRSTLLLNLQIIRDIKRPPTFIQYIEEISIEVVSNTRHPLFIRNLNKRENSRWHYDVITLASAAPVSNSLTVAGFHVDVAGNLWLNNTSESGSWNIVLRVTNKAAMGKYLSDLYHTCYIKTVVRITRIMDPSTDQCSNIHKLTSVLKENEPPATSVISLPSWYSDIIYTMPRDDYFLLSCSDYPMTHCRIISRINLDFERQQRFDLILGVTGTTPGRRRCSHTLVVSVHILDVDEFAPAFSHSEYSYSVPGGVPELGKVVFTVSASDGDRGRFGLVYYQLESNHDEHFDIHNRTGEIFIKNSFSFANETRSRRKRSIDNKEEAGYHRKTFLLNVIASSGERSSTVTVRLKVLVPLIPEESSNRFILTQSHIILIICLPCITIIIVVVIVAVVIRCRGSCLGSQPRAHNSVNSNDGSQSNQFQHKSQYPEYEVPSTLGGHRDISSLQNQAMLDGMRNPDIINCAGDRRYYDKWGSYDPHNHSTHYNSQSLQTLTMPIDELPQSSSTNCYKYIPNYNNNYNNIQMLQCKGNRSDSKLHDSDHSGTSSSCYSSINQQCPPLSRLGYKDTGQRSVDQLTDFTPAYRQRKTKPIGYPKQYYECQESIPLRTMDQNYRQSQNNVRNNIDIPNLCSHSSNGHLAQVISVDEPQFGAMSRHSQSSSNQNDTSNAQLYSDITSIDS